MASWSVRVGRCVTENGWSPLEGTMWIIEINRRSFKHFEP
jgi:hypothetical protein